MILIAIISLGGVGMISAVLLYAASKKFEVYVDPRIPQIQDALPAANCGGCGYPGCAAFAEACAGAGSMDGLYCPVGGAGVMSRISAILGKEVSAADPTVAVVRCNGTCEARPRTTRYDGAKNCAIASSLYGGETGCAYGCYGYGDCVLSCPFDAIRMNPETRLPEVVEDKCTACGNCVKACPKMIIELRRRGPKSRRIFVSCVNREKGGVARKSCSNACIGCGKCEKACAFEAISIADSLAYIHPDKCRLCRKCVPACPTRAIWEVNFPPRKEPAAAENKNPQETNQE
jgi:Na+-translocating ferredoxin:NAD+ oxidoreductase RNF subunit RnfB